MLSVVMIVWWASWIMYAP